MESKRAVFPCGSVFAKSRILLSTRSRVSNASDSRRGSSLIVSIASGAPSGAESAAKVAVKRDVRRHPGLSSDGCILLLASTIKTTRCGPELSAREMIGARFPSTVTSRSSVLIFRWAVKSCPTEFNKSTGPGHSKPSAGEQARRTTERRNKLLVQRVIFIVNQDPCPRWPSSSVPCWCQ